MSHKTLHPFPYNQVELIDLLEEAEKMEKLGACCKAEELYEEYNRFKDYYRPLPIMSEEE